MKLGLRQQAEITAVIAVASVFSRRSGLLVADATRVEHFRGSRFLQEQTTGVGTGLGAEENISANNNLEPGIPLAGTTGMGFEPPPPPPCYFQPPEGFNPMDNGEFGLGDSELKPCSDTGFEPPPPSTCNCEQQEGSNPKNNGEVTVGDSGEEITRTNAGVNPGGRFLRRLQNATGQSGEGGINYPGNRTEPMFDMTDPFSGGSPLPPDCQCPESGESGVGQPQLGGETNGSGNQEPETGSGASDASMGGAQGSNSTVTDSEEPPKEEPTNSTTTNRTSGSVVSRTFMGNVGSFLAVSFVFLLVYDF
jgi:hypothetical protein